MCRLQQLVLFVNIWLINTIFLSVPSTINVHSFLRQLDSAHIRIFSNLKDSWAEHKICGILVLLTNQSITVSLKSTSNKTSKSLIQRALFYVPNQMLSGFQKRTRLIHLYISKTFDMVTNLSGDKIERRFFHPIFVLLFYHHNLSESNIISLQDDLKNSGYLNRCYILTENFAKFSQFCLGCETGRRIKDFEFLEQALQQTDINLNGKHIETDLRGEERLQNFDICNKRVVIYGMYMKTPIEPEKCVLLLLGEKYNFTFRKNPPSKPMIIRRQTMSKSYMDNVVIPDMRHVLEHANELDPWAFIVVQPRKQGLDGAFVEIFDFTLWFCLLALYISMRFSTVLSLTVIRFKFSPGLNKFHNLLKVFKNLVDSGLYQGIKPYNQLWKHIKLHIMNKLLWGFTMGTLINLSYRAKLASTLTQTTQPSTLNTFEKLANSSLNIYTFLIVPRETGFKCLILDTLEEMASFRKQKQKQMPIHYLNFQKSIKFYPLFLYGMQRFAANLHIQLKNRVKIKNNVDYIPKQFAIFEAKKLMPMIKELIELFIPEMWISSTVTVNRFMIATPYTMESSYIYPIFKNGVARLWETGFFKRWTEYYAEMLALDNIRETQAHIDRAQMKSFGNVNRVPATITKNWFGYLEATKATLNQRSRLISNKSLTINDLKGVFILCLIVQLSLIFLLAVEKVFYNHVRFSNLEYRF